jgi:hypothetical protein
MLVWVTVGACTVWVRILRAGATRQLRYDKSHQYVMQSLTSPRRYETSGLGLLMRGIDGLISGLRRPSFVPPVSHILLNLHPDVLQRLSIALLERILRLCIPDQLRVLLASWHNACPIGDWVTNNTRLELHLGFHSLSIFHKLLNSEHRQRLRDGDEQRIVSNVAARAHSATVTEGPGARIRFWGLAEEALRAEGHRVSVDSRVVCEPPISDQQIAQESRSSRTYQLLARIKAPLGIL